MVETITSPNGVDASPIEAVQDPRLLIPQLNTTNVVFRIVGASELICHRWSEKAKQMMLDKQMKKAATAKEAKDPEQDYQDSLYVLPEWQQDETGHVYGFPATAFKSAMVRAGTYLDMKMTFLKGALHVDGEFVPIQGEPHMREDMVRLNGMTADIRYRGAFMPWQADVPITFNSSNLSYEQVANLLQQAGFSVGIGEWRPEKNGQYGRWTLA